MNELKTIGNYLKSDYYSFFRIFWRKCSLDELILSNHIELICNELNSLGNHIINRTYCGYDWLIINVPPGSSKSTIASILFPTWLLANDPSLFIINTSYSDSLATGFVRKSRDILTCTEFSNLFGAVELAKNNENFIETKQGGGRFASSTGGTLTGKHANVLIVDDPLSVEDSYSKTKRDRANRYITETLITRKRDKSNTPTIMIMQRLHEEDPTGYLLAKGLKVKYINLPAEQDGNETHPEMYTDGLLDPIRMSADILQTFKTTLGSFGYAGQFQQSPFPEGGGLVKREWFNIIDQVPEGITWDLFIDGAYTDKTKNDPTGLLVVGKKDNNIYVRNCHHAHKELPQLISFLPEYAALNGMNHLSRTYVEPKASGHSLEQYLRQSNLNPVLISNPLISQGKTARLNEATPSMESGKWHVLRGAWNDEFFGQLCGFPNAKHDEAVDLCGYAANRYFNKFFNKMPIIW